ncbi:hypothetical protein [Paenibacillus sp. DCT19]|uniref:hypothetical protein n=1 Tax=Paenibacillus sp. DCT19 TaxID=2211212 RepID=UPI0013E304B1|nr:hypothetical protein [Paenibacillus sp. DCT19]
MKEQLATVIQAWNSIPIKIMDIRKFALQSGQTIQSYVLPCSVFLLTLQGEAVIYLGQDELHTTGVQLLHGGKGTSLSIENGSQIMDVYMFLYKPQIGWVSLGNDEGKRSQQPLLQNYYFAPSYPLTLVSIAEQIYHGWTETDDLSRLQVKGFSINGSMSSFVNGANRMKCRFSPSLQNRLPVTFRSIMQSRFQWRRWRVCFIIVVVTSPECSSVNMGVVRWTMSSRNG